MKQKNKIYVIVGPTASGKSSLALRLARDIHGCIVNADSMQIYQDLQIISARPTVEEMEGIPHYLYGYADAHFQSSVMDWCERVKDLIPQVECPVFVGGTGMYISALIQGINHIPAVDPSVRQTVRDMPLDEVKAKVWACSATDPQRLRRALEVQLTTGKPLQYFQQQPRIRIIEADFEVIYLRPDRAWLYERCALRFHQMIAAGGVEEVAQLLTKYPTGGVLKAIGVPEICSYLQGHISKEDMCCQAILSTRHYAKRQMTWFNHQIQAHQILTSSTQNVITL